MLSGKSTTTTVLDRSFHYKSLLNHGKRLIVLQKKESLGEVLEVLEKVRIFIIRGRGFMQLEICWFATFILVDLALKLIVQV